jgi:hypothetical protein
MKRSAMDSPGWKNNYSYFSYLVLYFVSAFLYPILVRRATEMAFIAIVLVLYALSKIFDALEVFSVQISSFVNSDIGTVAIVALVAFLTYRWYKARHAGKEA